MSRWGLAPSKAPARSSESPMRVWRVRSVLVSIERGHDPGRFAIMAFGGGGALHVGALISEVGLTRAILPRFPGVTSALGCVIADLRHDHVETVNMMLDSFDAAWLEARMVASGEAAKAVVEGAGLAVERIGVTYELDMHYQGQTHTISAPLPVTLEGGVIGLSRELVRTSFEASYRRQFSRLLSDIPVRILSLRTAAIGRRPHFDLAALEPGPGLALESARRGTRFVWFAGERLRSAVWSRLDLPCGAIIEGPAVLEQATRRRSSTRASSRGLTSSATSSSKGRAVSCRRQDRLIALRFAE